MVTLPDVFLGLGRDLADASLANVDGLVSMRVRRVDQAYPVQDSMAYVQEQRQISLVYVPAVAPPMPQVSVIDWYNRQGQWVTIKWSYYAEGAQVIKKYSMMIVDVVYVNDGADQDTWQILLAMPRTELELARGANK